jgi:hypothetical protein
MKKLEKIALEKFKVSEIASDHINGGLGFEYSYDYRDTHISGGDTRLDENIYDVCVSW